MSNVQTEPVTAVGVEKNAALDVQRRIGFFRSAITPKRPPEADSRYKEYSLVFAEKSNSVVSNGMNKALHTLRRLSSEDKAGNQLWVALESEIYLPNGRHKDFLFLEDADDKAATALLTYELLKHVAWRTGVIADAGGRGYESLRDWAKSVIVDKTNLTHKILFGDYGEYPERGQFTDMATQLQSSINAMISEGVSRNDAMVRALRTTRELMNLRHVLKIVMSNKGLSHYEHPDMQTLWSQWNVVDSTNLIRRAIDDIQTHPLRFITKTSGLDKLGDNEGEAISSITVTDKFPVQPTPYGLGNYLESAEKIGLSKVMYALQGRDPNLSPIR